MAGIFNLFGQSDLNKGQVMKPLSRSKTTIGVTGASVKTVGLQKQKGLSIRSNSNLNVSASVQSNILNQDVSNKQHEYLKPKLTQLNSDGLPISPGKEFLLMKGNGYSSKLSDSSPKKVFDKKNIKPQKLSDETIFKKPFTPKNYTKKRYPEPESLAPYCDLQLEFDDIYAKTINNEFREFLIKKKNEVVPYEDEGFESDPEQIEYKIPAFQVSPALFDEGWRRCKTPDLPDISDDD